MNYTDLFYNDDDQETEERRACDSCGEYHYRRELTRINGQLVCETCEREAME